MNRGDGRLDGRTGSRNREGINRSRRVREHPGGSISHSSLEPETSCHDHQQDEKDSPGSGKHGTDNVFFQDEYNTLFDGRLKNLTRLSVFSQYSAEKDEEEEGGSVLDQANPATMV